MLGFKCLNNSYFVGILLPRILFNNKIGTYLFRLGLDVWHSCCIASQCSISLLHVEAQIELGPVVNPHLIPHAVLQYCRAETIHHSYLYTIVVTMYVSDKYSVVVSKQIN